jgi:hypothetical protein
MPFPSPHRYPPACPALLLEQHELAAGERVEAAQYEQGEDRHREIRTFTPWLASVAARMTQAEFDRFAQWFDDDLQAGAQRFDIQVHSLVGAGGQWWQAQFVGPYRFDARSGPRYLVNAELILLDGPYDTRPDVGLYGRAYGEGSATGRMDVPALLGWAVGEGNATLSAPVAALHGWAVGEGDATAFAGFTGLLLLEDGTSFLLLEGGTDRLYLEP